MKKKSVNPAMAMMAARAMRTPAAKPMGMPQMAPNAISAPPGMPAMPGMKKGGMMKSDSKEDTKMDKAQDKAMIKKAFKQHDMQEHKGGKGTKLALKKGGMMKKGGMSKGCGYASGGKTSQLAKANGIAVRGKSKGKIC